MCFGEKETQLDLWGLRRFAGVTADGELGPRGTPIVEATSRLETIGLTCTPLSGRTRSIRSTSWDCHVPMSMRLEHCRPLLADQFHVSHTPARPIYDISADFLRVHLDAMPGNR